MATTLNDLRERAKEKARARLEEIRADRERQGELEEKRGYLESSLSAFIQDGWKYIDPSPYLHNWHIDVMCEHLEAVTSGEIRRLAITVPPRHMKSLAVSVAWPAWTWARQARSPLSGPQVRFLSTSYAQVLSTRDSRKSRLLMTSPWYQEMWGDRFNFTGDQNAKQRYENDQGGYRIAAAVRGQLTGDGGDIVTVDDALNATEAASDTERQNMLEWWDEAMSTRLNDPKTGAYVLVMQRLHEKDLIGHVMDQESDWVHICLPARYEPDHPHVFAGDPRKIDGELLWPERVGDEQMKELEAKLGAFGTAGQLQQRPTPRGGGMFRPEWIQYYETMPPVRTMNIYILVDPANEKKKDSDWTAIFVIGVGQDGNYYVLDMVRDRLSLAERIKTLIKLHRVWRTRGGNILGVGYERYGIQADIEAIKMQMGREGYSFTITELGGRLSKVDRVARLEPLFYAGKIRLPYALYYTQYDSVTVDLINYLVEREYKNFPVSEYKDCLDALSRICDEALNITWPSPSPGRYSGSSAPADEGSWMV